MGCVAMLSRAISPVLVAIGVLLTLRGPLVAAEALPITEIAPGVFVHKGAYEDVNPHNRGDISNIGFIVGEKVVAVIDTGNARWIGDDLRAAIKAKTGLPIAYVINTHAHPDHIFGNAAFKDDKPEFVGHAKLEAEMRTKAPYYLQTLKTFVGEAATKGIEIVPPTRTVKPGESITLDLGGRTLTITGYPTAHSESDVTVYDDKTQTLWTGDLLFVDRVPAIDGSILGWVKAIAELKKITAARAVPGHGPAAVPWPQSLSGEERYFSLLLKDIRAIQKAHGKIEDATKTAGTEDKDRWALFDDYNARNVTAAFVELEWE